MGSPTSLEYVLLLVDQKRGTQIFYEITTVVLAEGELEK
jgi:hypothetical protein